MKKILTGIAFPIITLGVIALVLNLSIGNTIDYIYKEQIPGTTMYWYRYDVWEYVNGLKNGFREYTELALTLPTREWQELDIDFWNQLGNNLAIILDYMIFAINILLYPIRIGFYLIQIILNVIGIKTLPGTYDDNPLYWLIHLTYGMKKLQIPYV